ncbi:sulfur carrier protein [Salinibacillus kushneri]|uniref:Sulfur carrier protein n=1 Tax=Salinibacillus kushneri TaxID=237682 RepID=A0A1I0DWB5_9BACI|nr:sulfur carrier protein ThiS [Salinibacillus kushneri]SET36785.1 sulfur carrier protein [Salinibacillus kushneri]
MNLLINGDYVNIPSHIQSVESLLNHFKLDQQIVVVELNGTILEKDKQNQYLTDGDKLELVHFVGGG